jgi:hypothetical protein
MQVKNPLHPFYIPSNPLLSLYISCTSLFPAKLFSTLFKSAIPSFGRKSSCKPLLSTSTLVPLFGYICVDMGDHCCNESFVKTVIK